jgi:gliding motility-associated-like protein
VVNNNGCEKTDTISVDFVSNPEFTLGEDKTLCDGDELILNPGSGYVSYLWQNGETSQFFTVTETGYYSVTVSNGCGEASDTIFVQVYPVPNPYLGPDTTICMGDILILEPGGSFSSYLWQDNSNLAFYSVTSSGIYTVQVENIFGCEASDEIFVTVSDPQVNLGDDNFICEGDSIVLDGGPGFVSYLWMPVNSTNQSIVVKTDTTYTLTVFDAFGCEATDEILISLYPFPNADLGGDKEICTGDTLMLSGPDGDFTYYWNGQPGGQNYIVYDSGNYTLSVVNLCDSVSDVIQVTENEVPEVFLGLDEVIIPGQSIELDAGEGHDQYLWQDGATGQFYTVSESNIDPEKPYYYVDVYEGMCKNSDTIKIELFKVWVPNVITPNGDEFNNLFQPDPEKWQAVKKHKMTVFNRWGEVVWESEDFPSGWDGKQNGKYVAEGSYFWILDAYYGNDNIKRTFKGSLTVLGTTK